jgi:mono/diheme cytochrome c family protein
VKKEGLPANAVPGAKLFAQSGCLTCHTYLGTGSSNLGAPDLSKEGSKGKGIDFQIRHLKNPRDTTPGSPMPSFASLGEANIRKIAIFLEASKGPK